MRSHIYDNPADDPEALPFLKAVAAGGKNQLPRMQFADWLDENGYDNASAAQRWAAKNGRYPQPSTVRSDGEWEGPGTPGGWFGEDSGKQIESVRPHSLPEIYHTNFLEHRRNKTTGRIDPSIVPHGSRFLSSIHDDKPQADRAELYERAFLAAGHDTPHDENGEPRRKTSDTIDQMYRAS